jgi:guanosine-3',5'-bis(diphosphate) 3'-pyrophosphohydrolase
MVIHFAKCCRPIAGDAIMGLFSPGKGIVVHRQGCHNVGDFQRLGDNWLDLQWEQDTLQDLPTEIQVEVGNKRGVLATVAAVIAEMGSNIENVRSQDYDDMTTSIGFLITVHNRDHLASVMRRLRALAPVLRIMRVMPSAPVATRSARVRGGTADVAARPAGSGYDSAVPARGRGGFFLSRGEPDAS